MENDIKKDKLTSNLKIFKFGNTNVNDNKSDFNRKSISRNINQTKKSAFIDSSQLPKINQTIYLRLFTEHCLYWACYFNYKDTIINMFLSLYNARPAFPLFCLNNRTSLQAGCIKGILLPFQLLYKTYEIKKKLVQDIKSEKKYLFQFKTTKIIILHIYPIQKNIINIKKKSYLMSNLIHLVKNVENI